MSYRIVETEDGLTVSQDFTSSQESAPTVVVDPGPYDKYEEALEALSSLQREMDPAQDVSGVPGNEVLESRTVSDAS